MPSGRGSGKRAGGDTDGELGGSQALGAIGASYPRPGDRVGFRPGGLHARGAEAGHRPIHGAIAGLRTRRPAADAVAEFAQIVEERRWPTLARGEEFRSVGLAGSP